MAVVVTRQIGDTFNYKGEEYQMVESESKDCFGCAFDGECRSQELRFNPCVAGIPAEFKFVKFIKK